MFLCFFFFFFFFLHISKFLGIVDTISKSLGNFDTIFLDVLVSFQFTLYAH